MAAGPAELVPVAFWLLPAEPWHARLSEHIAELSRTHGTPAFEPHVSLHVGVAGPDDDLATLLDAVAGAFEPFEMVAGPTAHGSVRFKSLFITFDDPRPALLQARLRSGLAWPRDYALAPHLSLLYAADLAVPDREALARGAGYDGEPMRFDALAVVRPGADGHFDDVAGWDTGQRRTLVGRSSPPLQPAAAPA